MPPALELREITKRFPGVVANDRVSLAVEWGEIRALIGENGAGKTTLMNILFGLEQPDSGQILIAGEPQRFQTPLAAIDAGLGMVHQHFKLFPHLSVAENVVYGREPVRRGFVDRAAARRAVGRLAEDWQLPIDPDARVGSLPVGLRQQVEILKMLYRGARILILDEPTAVLTPQERDGLFAILRSLANEGKSIIFITHKLPEVLALSDRATALRDGAVTGTVRTADADAAKISRLMVGRDVDLEIPKRSRVSPGEVLLSVTGLGVSGPSGRPAVRDLDLAVRAGEIVAVAGAAGNGQTELIEAISGLRVPDSGAVLLNGIDVTDRPVAARRRTGQSHIPEDRDDHGLALAATVSDNLLMGFEDHPEMARQGVLISTAVSTHARSLIEQFAVKTASIDVAAASLSGGNRQKLALARELAHRSRLLIAEQPTRGVDLGATQQIYEWLVEYRDAGNGILLVSTDLNEILALADRIVVMFEGALVGELAGTEASEEAIGLLMAGGRS